MFLKNHKVVVLSGYARGGTNIVWNILQSHPRICSPVFETGEVFDKSLTLKACQILSHIGSFDFCKKLIDRKLFQFKLKNLEHPDNKYITQDKLYKKRQVEESVLCTKSVNEDIYITDLMLDIYPNLYFAALCRNGYALAESYIRRGHTARKAGFIYTKIAKQMENYSKKIAHFKLIRFEDCLQDPFGIANELFSFLEMEDNKLDKLRLKSKKVINKENNHTAKYGKENRKYWFNRENIGQILDPHINKKQIQRLTTKQIKEFNREAEEALKFFGYEIL